MYACILNLEFIDSRPGGRHPQRRLKLPGAARVAMAVAPPEEGERLWAEKAGLCMIFATFAPALEFSFLIYRNTRVQRQMALQDPLAGKVDGDTRTEIEGRVVPLWVP